MSQNEAPKSDSSHNIHVADAITVEMTDRVYSTAKLQNRLRWTLVVTLSACSFFFPEFIGGKSSYATSCCIGVFSYFLLSKFLPLANLTSTTKFKKFGDQQKMDKINRKLGLGKYAEKEDK